MISSESRIRETRTSGSMSGGVETRLWHRLRHRHKAKAAGKQRLSMPTARRATPRLYLLGDVLGHDVGDRLPPGRRLQFAADPGALGPGEYVGRRRLAVRKRTVVEVRRARPSASSSTYSRRREIVRPSSFGRRLPSRMACSRVNSTRTPMPGSRSSMRTAPRCRRPRPRSRVLSRTASRSGWPGQMKAAGGCRLVRGAPSGSVAVDVCGWDARVLDHPSSVHPRKSLNPSQFRQFISTHQWVKYLGLDTEGNP